MNSTRHKKILKNGEGMSLVGVLVAAGMMGGLALFLANMAKQQHVAQKRADTGVAMTALHQTVLSVLNDGESCTETLRGIGMGGVPSSGTPLAGGLKNRSGKAVVKSGKNGNLLEVGFTLKNPNIPSGTGPRTGNAEIEMVVKKLSSAVVMGKTVTETIPLIVEVDGSGNLVNCRSTLDSKALAIKLDAKREMCASIGGVWTSPNCSIANLLAGKADVGHAHPHSHANKADVGHTHPHSHATTTPPAKPPNTNPPNTNPPPATAGKCPPGSSSTEPLSCSNFKFPGWAGWNSGGAMIIPKYRWDLSGKRTYNTCPAKDTLIKISDVKAKYSTNVACAHAKKKCQDDAPGSDMYVCYKKIRTALCRLDSRIVKILSDGTPCYDQVHCKSEITGGSYRVRWNNGGFCPKNPDPHPCPQGGCPCIAPGVDPEYKILPLLNVDKKRYEDAEKKKVEQKIDYKISLGKKHWMRRMKGKIGLSKPCKCVKTVARGGAMIEEITDGSPSKAYKRPVRCGRAIVFETIRTVSGCSPETYKGDSCP